MMEETKKKRIWSIVGYSAIIIAFLVSVGFADHRQEEMPCTDVKVVINDTLGHNFVETGEILDQVQNKFGTLKGKALGSINISLLEKIINTNPFISKAEVFSTIDGKINIEVKQRTPIVQAPASQGGDQAVATGPAIRVTDRSSGNVGVIAAAPGDKRGNDDSR